MFDVIFYTTFRGVSPIEVFLNNCDVKLRAKILRQLKFVETYGLTQAIPSLKKLTGTSLWEIRILGKNNIRVVCGNLADKKISVVHVFRKNTKKTSREDLRLAVKRHKEMLTDDIV